MRLVRFPGVYRPQGDTWLLRRALETAGVPEGGCVLDIGTGTGALAVAAAKSGARRVTAVDVSAQAVAVARLNVRARALPVRVDQADALERAYSRPFDLVLANPPYLPSERADVPHRGPARAWDAGCDGRRVIDRLCDRVPELLAPGGTLLMVQSSMSDVDATVSRIRETGMKAAVVDRRSQPFGPLQRGRVAMLEARGLIGAGQRVEELVVVRADRTE